MSNKGRLFVLSGPSGTGKSTVVQRLVESHEHIRLSISATTRAPRDYETHGQEYFFLTKEEFEGRIERGEMLEYACYNGNFYGTPLDKVEQWLEEGFDVMLEIEVQGARQVKARMPNAILMFLVPPSMAEAEQRLRGRNSESDETFRARIEVSRDELAQAQYYDYVIVNTTVEDTICDIETILRAEHLRYSNMEDFVQALLQEMKP